MAFENVNVNKLEKSLEDCLNSINHKSTTNIIANLSSNNVWSTNSRNTLRNSLSKLKDERYIELKNYLTKCLNIVDEIKEYKRLYEMKRGCDTKIEEETAKILGFKKLNKFYLKKKNDTLQSIALKYGVPVRGIKIINNLNNNNISNLMKIYIFDDQDKLKVVNYVNNITKYEDKISELKKNMNTLENKISNIINLM